MNKVFGSIVSGLEEAIDYSKSSFSWKPKEFAEEFRLAKTKVDELRASDGSEVIEAYWEGRLESLKRVAELFNIKFELRDDNQTGEST